MRIRQTSVALLLILVLLCSSLPVITADAAQGYKGTINKDNALLRKQPVAAGFILRLKKGDVVEVYSLCGDFYKVTFGKKTGYVTMKYVDVSSSAAKALAKTKTTTAQNDPKMNGIKRINQIKVPATSKKGNSGQNVLALQQALKIKNYLDAPINSKFDNATVEAVKAYQKDARLTVTGEADFATIKKLFGKDAANFKPTPKITPTPKKTPTPTPKKTPTPTPKKTPTPTPKKTPTPTPKKTPTPTPKKTPTPTPKKTATPTPSKLATEELIWFSKGKATFPAGAKFQVKDVATGKVWNCQRLYAGNHLDAEPLTAADTEIMKAAYGGEFNYVRRAVLVKINGHVYGGSMYGEPHGDYKIKNNNFDGQFCIHFTGSLTSSSKVLDSAHQAAIKKALNAKW